MFEVIPVPSLSTQPVGAVLEMLSLEIIPGPEAATATPGVEQVVLRGPSLPQFRAQLYGGQVLAQAFLAACATAPGRLPHSVHTYFMRAGGADSPVTYTVDLLRDGRSFATRQISARQGERELARTLASFQVPQAGLDTQVAGPDHPNWDAVPSALEVLEHTDHPVAKFLGRTASFEMRHVNGHLYSGDKTPRHTRQAVWLRPRCPIPSTDQLLHRALLTYVSDQFMLEPALRSHGLTWRSPGLALATLDHAMWYHRDVDINDWVLLDQVSTTSQGGRAMAQARVYDTGGRLIATCTQEGMLRLPEDGASSWRFEEPPVP